MSATTLATLLLSSLLLGAAAHAGDLPPIAESAEAVKPVAVGEKAPDATLTTPDGEPVTLASRYAEGPTALVFYRGGWCPYCTTHLAGLGAIEGDLRALGVRLIAISPDLPEHGRATAEKFEVGYTLLADPKVHAARAFGLAFTVDAATVDRYKTYGIDLEKSSGESHHALPVPAVVLVDEFGVVRFMHADPDYKQRLDNTALLAAAKALTATAE